MLTIKGITVRLGGRTIIDRASAVIPPGGKVGLMGIVADSAMAAGVRATGVIPPALAALEVEHRGLRALHIVGSMHERKAMMADLSDGFIALSGGIGTFEELFEIWTWGQLGDHRKPVALLNIAGFYDKLVARIEGRENVIRHLLAAAAGVDDEGRPEGALA